MGCPLAGIKLLLPQIVSLEGKRDLGSVSLLIDAGKVCAGFPDDNVRNVQSRRVQVDEIWSFTYAKQKNVPAAKSAPEEAGDTWTWTAIDADNKLILSWLIGGRDGEYALACMDDLRGRLANRVQLTSDGHRAYLEAVEGARLASRIGFGAWKRLPS